MDLLRFGFLLSNFLISRAEIRVSLNSDNSKWSVRNMNNSINITANVPGGIYSDLQAAGVISSNLFYRFNDIEYRWVGQDDWEYRSEFVPPTNVLRASVINLVFHGVDTVASIRLNGKIIATLNNMFVRYALPVKDHLIEGMNTLLVRFNSSISEAAKLANNHNYTVPPRCVPVYYNGECHVNFLRKMQASFAWDWGPAFPSVGIWKPVELEAFDSAVLRDVTTAMDEYNATAWRINATLYLETGGNQIGSFNAVGHLETESNPISAVSTSGRLENHTITANLLFIVPKKKVDLWWPNGLGRQPLYHLNVSFESKGELTEKRIKIGVRKVQLVQDRIRPPKEGTTFFFRVNGLPVFAKGSNWIPSHILPEMSYDEKRIRSLLLSAKEAHMNVLRVWGGGLYESDLFYRMADELGLMIWQDMMFACAMYPTDSEFLSNVKIETEQQIRRLQHHPSIILWAGNNENEAALRGNWYGTAHDIELYKSDYVKLYVDTIRPTVLQNDGTRSYTVSSPSNGIESESEGYIAKDPYSPLYGDTHFYNYVLDSWSSNTYPNTRFASEYGFQSLPSIHTMEEVTLPSDRKIESQFSAKRQHLLAGYLLMTLLIKMRLPLPKKEDSEEYYKSFIYYSQVAQAMGIKTETEKYRRDRNKLTKSNEGRTMGAMYWQLNDVWEAPTWSSIGKWKMLHYYAAKFFSPVIISPDLTIDNNLNVFIVSDLLSDVPEAEMKVYVYSWNSFKPKKVMSSKERIKGNRSKIYARYELSDLLKVADCNQVNCFLYFKLITKKFQVDNFLFPVSFTKVTNLRPANLSTTIVEYRDNEISLELSTNEIAPFVWLESKEMGQFSENGFTLIEKTKVVKFGNRKTPIDVGKFINTLTVRSLLQ